MTKTKELMPILAIHVFASTQFTTISQPSKIFIKGNNTASCTKWFRVSLLNPFCSHSMLSLFNTDSVDLHARIVIFICFLSCQPLRDYGLARQYLNSFFVEWKEHCENVVFKTVHIASIQTVYSLHNQESIGNFSKAGIETKNFIICFLKLHQPVEYHISKLGYFAITRFKYEHLTQSTTSRTISYYKKCPFLPKKIL